MIEVEEQTIRDEVLKWRGPEWSIETIFPIPDPPQFVPDIEVQGWMVMMSIPAYKSTGRSCVVVSCDVVFYRKNMNTQGRTEEAFLVLPTMPRSIVTQPGPIKATFKFKTPHYLDESQEDEDDFKEGASIL